MKENSIKNERSSIEEDIILLKDFTEGNFKRDKLENYKGSYKMGYFYYKDIQQAIEHILKELKRFENMYEAEHQIHLVRNEQLDRKQKAIIKCNELENENKELKKEIKSWKKCSAEQEENIIEKNNIICNLEFQIEKLQKENENFEKLNKDYSYSVDIVRENTRLRRQVFDLELESEKLKNTDLEQAKIEYLEVLNEKLQKENEGLKEYIAIAPNLDEMTAVKYRNIKQDAYIKGRAEEQQRAEQIIYENYIPIQKVKEKIRKNEEIIDISNDGDLIHELLQKNKVYEELLESEE